MRPHRLPPVLVVALGMVSPAAPASAHPGALDNNAGHWRRAAGAKAKQCSKPKTDFGYGW